MSKIDHSLFSAHEHALEKEYEVCPQCGSELVVRHSPKGPFLGCASYPKCDYKRALKSQDSQTLKVLDEAPCPQCGKALAVKQGRYGMFIGCTGFPDCHYVADSDEEQDTGLPCPRCNKGELLERVNKFGKRFWGCSRYPGCKFLLNEQPREGQCASCGFGLLVSTRQGKLRCADKKCGAIQEDLE
ncbi:topoisomerase DNA-binding C4 zinc finger domain-containing protein [Gallaecimonas sp. GXIMD4217]|uniref:DNA topoisomerase family protein n=1 Tax=Gallaecimonas sp. GXIMD4217 TaxID=3131927 RepID=UPI00311AF91D